MHPSQRAMKILQALSVTLSLAVVALSCHVFHLPPWAASPGNAHAELRRVAAALANPVEEAALRQQNPEWLLMANTFTAFGLADAAAEPAFAPEAARLMDAILTRIQRQQPEDFLLPYHRAGAWRVARGASESVFYLGEVSLVLGRRRAIRDDNPAWKVWHQQLVARLDDMLARSPHGYAESYPDEAWTFCNAIALASLVEADRLDGTDHRARVTAWKAGVLPLVDGRTGLLPSAYSLEGHISQGPEGSSIWTVVAFLSVVDEPLARQQYALATRWLAGETLGFSFGREWPAAATAEPDIDSGLTVLGVGPASTGFLLAAARVMGDRERMLRTRALLDLVAPSVEEPDGARHYLPSNLMGDAVFAFAGGGAP